jgi:hypothetical protein
MQVGTQYDLSDLPFSVLDAGEAQRLLGLNVGIGLDEKVAWDQKKAELFQLLTKFQNFHLSEQGRVTTAKVYALSKIWFASMFHTPSDEWLTDLTKMCEKFILRKKLANGKKTFWPHKINLIYVPTSKHGYGALRTESQWSAFQVKWIQALLSPAPAKWKSLVMSNLLNFSATENRITYPWRLDPSVALCPHIPLNRFKLSERWKFFFKTARRLKINFEQVSDVRSALSQPLFFNSNMTYINMDNAYAFFSHLGITCVGDLYRSEFRPPCHADSAARLVLKDASAIIALARVRNVLLSDRVITTRYDALISNIPSIIKNFIYPFEYFDFPRKRVALTRLVNIVLPHPSGSGCIVKVGKKEEVFENDSTTFIYRIMSYNTQLSCYSPTSEF